MEFWPQPVDISVDAVFERGKGGIDRRLATAVVADNQDKLIVVQQIAELHHQTPHGP